MTGTLQANLCLSAKRRYKQQYNANSIEISKYPRSVKKSAGEYAGGNEIIFESKHSF